MPTLCTDKKISSQATCGVAVAIKALLLLMVPPLPLQEPAAATGRLLINLPVRLIGLFSRPPAGRIGCADLFFWMCLETCQTLHLMLSVPVAALASKTHSSASRAASGLAERPLRGAL